MSAYHSSYGGRASDDDRLITTSADVLQGFDVSRFLATTAGLGIADLDFQTALRAHTSVAPIEGDGETIVGTDGNDALFGSDGDDVIDGGRGRDFLNGGSGADRLTGGLGRDTFALQNASDSVPDAPDLITDFRAGSDVLDLLSFAAEIDDLSVEIDDGVTVVRGMFTSRFDPDAADLFEVRSLTAIRLDDLRFQGNSVIAADDVVTVLRTQANKVFPLANDAFTFLGVPELRLLGDAASDPRIEKADFSSFFTFTPDPSADDEPATVSIDYQLVSGERESNVATITLNVVTPDVSDGGLFTGTGDDDAVIGSVGADEINTGAGNDIIVTQGGTNVIRPGLGNDRIQFDDGIERVIGTLEELDGDIFQDIGREDVVTIEGLSVFKNFVPRTNGGSLFLFDRADGETAEIAIESTFEEEFVFYGQTTGATSITKVGYAPFLSEMSRVDAEDINGIEVAKYLSADTSSRFEVVVRAAAVEADFTNSLGVYEVRADGTIADVRLLAEDTKAFDGRFDERGRFVVEDIDEGSGLGFFIIKDGAALIEAGIVDPASIGIDIVDGDAVLTGADGRIDAATIFVSHDSALNPDDQEHVLSGISGIDTEDRNRLLIGFEDLTREGENSDDDFQDVVFTVEALPPIEMLAG
ncbi:MAG: DUF4114 domain-containing protein [Pseudomonadota bacterium]